MNVEAIGELMDGKGEIAADMAGIEVRISRLVDQLRFQHEVIAQIHEFADPKSKTPLRDLEMIRIKAQVAMRQAAQSVLLS